MYIAFIIQMFNKNKILLYFIYSRGIFLNSCFTVVSKIVLSAYLEFTVNSFLLWCIKLCFIIAFCIDLVNMIEFHMCFMSLNLSR